MDFDIPKDVAAFLAERRGPEALVAYERIRAPGFSVRLMGANAALLVGDFARAEREARAALAIAEQPEPGTRLLQAS